MRFLMYAKTNGVEQLFYDSESGNARMAVAQPSLKLELSKAGSLDFTILPTHPMYDSFMKMKTYVRVMQDDEEIFRGRVLQIEDTTYMERQIQCEGDLAYLIDSLQPPQQTVAANTTSTITKSNASYRAQYGNHVPAKSSTTKKVTLGSETNTTGQLATQFARYISHHNSQMETEKQFTVGNVTVDDVGTVSFKSTSYRDTKESIDSDLVKQYGGYLQTRKNPNGPTYIDWLKQPTETSSQRIVLGMNMIDLQQQFEGDELFTIFVPTGDSDLTIASVNGGNIGLEDAVGIAKYGRIYKTQSYSGVKDAAELKKLGQDYMTANYKPEKMSLNVKAIDMNLLDGEIDAIHVGSIVTVISDPHDIDVSLTCISIEYDIQNPENNSYEIGDPSETLSQKNATSAAATAAATASAKRSGSYAGAAAVTMEDVINRHAENISDHADSLYKLEADLVQIHAKCIEITATEKVTITADTIDMNASGEINLTSRGKMTMASNAQINFNDNLYIGDVMAGYDFYNIGNAWMQSLTIGGHLYVADIQDEDNGKWDTGVLSGFTSVKSMSYALYESGNLGTISGYLEDAVTSFGTATDGDSGEVSIPYYTFSSGTTKAGDITFNIADMEYYQDHVGIRSIGNWYWGGDDDRNYYALVTANDGTQQAVTQPAITMDTILGTNWYTNVLAKGPADSGTQYTVGSQLVYLQADNNNCYITNTSSTPTSGSSGNIIAQIANPKPSNGGIRSIGNWYWGGDNDRNYYAIVTANDGTQRAVTQPTITMDTVLGTNWYTNVLAKGPADSGTKYTVGSQTVYLQADGNKCYITSNSSTPSASNIIAQITNPGKGTVTAITAVAIGPHSTVVSSFGVTGTNINSFAGDSTFSLESTTYRPSASVSTTQHCVNLNHGSDVVGRVNIEPVYSAGIAAGEAKFEHATVTPQGESDSVLVEVSSGGSDYYTADSPVTLYEAGTPATYYAGDGGTFTVQGESAGEIRKCKTSGSIRIQGYGSAVLGYKDDDGNWQAFPRRTWYYASRSGTYYYLGEKDNSLYLAGTTTVEARGTEVSVTPVGNSSTITPVNASSKKNLIATTRYKAGTPDTTTYYTKTS